MDGRNGPQSDLRLRAKLTEHLYVRLAEYEEEGVRAAREEGAVLARLPGMDGAQAARCLEERGIFARTEGENVRFLIGPEVSFEDLDYVQGVAAKLL